MLVDQTTEVDILHQRRICGQGQHVWSKNYGGTAFIRLFMGCSDVIKVTVKPRSHAVGLRNRNQVTYSNLERKKVRQNAICRPRASSDVNGVSDAHENRKTRLQLSQRRHTVTTHLSYKIAMAVTVGRVTSLSSRVLTTEEHTETRKSNKVAIPNVDEMDASEALQMALYKNWIPSLSFMFCPR